MAQYLIAIDFGEPDDIPVELYMVEAKNMKEAARTLDARDGCTGQIWRVAGPPKTITMNVFTKISIDVT